MLVVRAPLDPQAETSRANTTTRVAPPQRRRDGDMNSNPTRILRDPAHLVDRRRPRFTGRGYLFQGAGAMLHLCSEPTVLTVTIPSGPQGVPVRTRVRLTGRQLSIAAATRRCDRRNFATHGGYERRDGGDLLELLGTEKHSRQRLWASVRARLLHALITSYRTNRLSRVSLSGFRPLIAELAPP
jgi:hypothetical protein